jgi:hypothetical protein
MAELTSTTSLAPTSTPQPSTVPAPGTQMGQGRRPRNRHRARKPRLAVNPHRPTAAPHNRCTKKDEARSHGAKTYGIESIKRLRPRSSEPVLAAGFSR